MSTTHEAVHPLFIPKGSVRALVTLTVVSATCYRLVMVQELGVPLTTALFIVLAYYFAHRGSKGASGGAKSGGKHPLFLPRGAVRSLLFLGFAATAGLMYFRPSWIPATDKNPLKENWQALVTLGAFFAGVLLQFFYAFRKKNPAVKTPFLDLFDHAKAVLVIVAALYLGYGDKVGLGGLFTDNGLVGALAAIAFYFGSR